MYRLRVPLNKQHGNRAQTLFKSERQQLYHIYWLLRTQLSLKKLQLVTCKILGLFVNTFTSCDKYFVLKRNNLTQPIQIQLSQKQKTFSEILS